MTTTTPTAGPLDRRTDRPSVWSVFLPLLAGVVALIVALVLIVVIRPLGWRLLATIALWVVGVAALIVFADAADESLGDRTREWGDEALHCVSASLVALALAVILGAFLPSLFGLSASPSLFSAVGVDVLIGFLAGVLTLVVTVSSGWAGGELSYRLGRAPWIGDTRSERFRLSLRAEWSWRDAGRIVVLAVAGVLVSAGFTQLFAAAPSNGAAPAADTAPKLPSVWTSVVLPVIVWFLTAALVWLVFDRVGRQSPRKRRQAHKPDPRPTHHLRRATHASALAVALAILIGWSSAWVLDDVIRTSLSTHGTPVGVSLQSVPPDQQVSRLAEEFVPQFELAQGERWTPTTVNWYIAHSRLTSSQTFCMKGPNTEPQGCRELCTTKSGTGCAPVCDQPDPQACAPPGGSPHAVYYLYRDVTNPPQGDHLPGSGHNWAVLQYWIFYDYDSLSAGPITQWHQSDWEQVSVLLDRSESTANPVAVAFSEHCYGAVVPATEVSWNGSHPISYVGLGSHGNYPTQNDLPIRQLQCLTRQTPRYLGAAGLFFNPRVAGWSLELPIAYLIGLRDHTGHARTVADAKPIPEQTTPSISSFHGYWGVDNNLRIVAGGVPTGAGPESPQDQGPSLKPFDDMFCGSSWLRISTRATTWMCPP